MPQKFSIKVKGLEELQRKYGQAKQVIEKHNRPAMEKSVDLTRDNARSFAPELSGNLKSEIQGEIRGTGAELEGAISPSKSIGQKVYPYVIEFGRGGGMPPVASIQEKMGVGPTEAFLIARAIGRRGHKAFEYMLQGWEKSKDKVSDLFRKALRDIVRDLD